MSRYLPAGRGRAQVDEKRWSFESERSEVDEKRWSFESERSEVEEHSFEVSSGECKNFHKMLK
ncbi:hypothetical protein A2996_01340 [Candidatus Campbellbacteria bacterium RIFCSPLOWO2_01_FULL_34_15]|uniref:Uncharacterized protein n=2 Tax=Candidatus Campbelliibacteriota TaxID=1752727 RepID=A0A1F5EPC5_9BACT|nr:MAG: hypothetical protein A2811_00520 [Candidatus Campbellbacteria bacterium RIFCSPHIGHO2_01_FULL_34_10]OGD69243.1 MAG: hypothetical protein A2996_01340 [Candidatus Campbellbacteria bacterium RIFCSPLOWO2_01_FULL_34_15]